jgi:hypothetical protein
VFKHHDYNFGASTALAVLFSYIPIAILALAHSLALRKITWILSTYRNFSMTPLQYTLYNSCKFLHARYTIAYGHENSLRFLGISRFLLTENNRT